MFYYFFRPELAPYENLGKNKTSGDSQRLGGEEKYFDAAESAE
jgi:hypothetical protein